MEQVPFAELRMGDLVRVLKQDDPFSWAIITRIYHDHFNVDRPYMTYNEVTLSVYTGHERYSIYPRKDETFYRR